MDPSAARTALWQDIRSAWISTDKSNRELSREFGVCESAIRKRAQKESWGPRNAPARKRAIVEAALAGAIPGAQECAVRPEDAIQGAAMEAVADMRLGAHVARLGLLRCRQLLELFEIDEETKTPDPAKPWVKDPRDVKALMEAARVAIETIRRALALDDPQKGSPEASPLEALAQGLAAARAARCS